MNTSCGPWTIMMAPGPRTQLNTFWRRRIALLSRVRMVHSSPTMLRIAIVIVAVLFGGWPLLRLESVSADAPEKQGKAADTAKPNAGGPSSAAESKVATKKEPFPYQFENLSIDTSPESGLFQFRLHVPKGVRFGVELRCVGVEDNGAGANFQFESESIAPLTLAVSFKRLDGKAGAAIMSRDKLVQCAADCGGTYPGGVTTVINVPFDKVDPADLSIARPSGSTDWGGQDQFMRRAVIIYPKSTRANKFDDTKPRLEIGFYEVQKEAPRETIANESPLQTLNRHWRRQEHLISAADIRFRIIRSGGSGLKRLSRADFATALADLDLAARPDDLKKLAERVCRERPKGPLWGTGELAVLGPKARETTLNAEGKPWEVWVCNGDLELNYDADNHHASVWKVGESHTGHTSLYDFVSTPNFTGRESSMKVEVTDGKLMITGQSMSMVVDADNGFVHEHSSVHGDNARDLRYFGCTRFPGGALFPRAAVAASFDKNRLNQLLILVVENARLNESLPDDTFRLSVPENTDIFDFRQDTFRPQYRGKTPVTTDIIEYLNVKDALKAKSAENRQ